MLKLFKKAFWIPYEDSAVYPTKEKASMAIAEYCEKNGCAYTILNSDEVVIDGVVYEVYRGLESGSRGNYGIKCTEKW